MEADSLESVENRVDEQINRHTQWLYLIIDYFFTHNAAGVILKRTLIWNGNKYLLQGNGFI